MATTALQRLTTLPEALRVRGFDPPAFRYIRDAAINGVFPAQQVNHIWHFNTADIDVIERALRRMCAQLPEKPLGLLEPDAPSRGEKRNGIAKALAAAAA